MVLAWRGPPHEHQVRANSERTEGAQSCRRPSRAKIATSVLAEATAHGTASVHADTDTGKLAAGRGMLTDANATAANVCILLSSTGQTSGQITYVQQ